MSRVIGMGNALVDVLAQVKDEQILERLELPKGSMQLIDTARYEHLRDVLSVMPTKRTTGGSAANTILALANLGEHPGFIGKVANDEYGKLFAANSRRYGIDFVQLDDKSKQTGIASVFITPDGQRTFGTYLGAAANMQASEIRAEHFAGYDYLYIEGYLVQNHELIERAVDLAREAGLKTCLDLASYNIVEQDHDFFTTLLKKIDIVFANEEESFAYTHKAPEAALAELASVCETAVVKIGSRGSLVQRGDEVASAPAMKVHVVDTTAAGDYFAAGFLYGQSHGRSLADSLRIGTLLAGNIVQVVGTRLEENVWNEIKKQL